VTRIKQKMAERAVIEAFRQHYSGFPKGEIKDSESPDFMVESIGIELIEFQRGTARKFEESCKAICKAVEVRVAQSIVVSQFYVAVHWKSDIEPIRKTEIQSFAGSIIKALCTIPQPFSGNFQLGYKILNQSGLDGHINLISVYSTPNHKKRGKGYRLPPSSWFYMVANLLWHGQSCFICNADALV